MNNIKDAIRSSARYNSGHPFRASDLMPEAGRYHPKTYTRAFRDMLALDEIERGDLKGYYRKKSWTLAKSDLESLIERIDKGQVTLKSESHRYPVSYHTLSKLVRHCRKGVGRYA